VEFELEVLSGRLHKSLFVDGRTTDHIDAVDGHRLLLDLDSQSVLVVTKRGDKMLIPTASFAGLMLDKAVRGAPPAPPPPPAPEPEVPTPLAGELADFEDEAWPAPGPADDVDPLRTAASGADDQPAAKPKAKKPPLKRKR
jgi:hypothetical protein